MKRIIAISLFLVISALIIILPYRESTLILLGGVNVKRAIYQEIAAIFTLGLWTYVAFLFVLIPLVLLLQIRQSPLTWYKRVFFLLEGIIALLAALVMSFHMFSSLFEAEVILTPIFYVALCWVILGVIASILLAIKKLYAKAAKFLYS